MAKTTFVYVGQFDYFWKLTEAQWREVIASGLSGEGYTLEPYRELKTRPRFLWRDRETGRCSRMVNDKLYYEPLDWDQQNFQHALEELNEVVSA